MVALGITAPDESVTTPSNDASEPTCAKAAQTYVKVTISRNRKRLIFLIAMTSWDLKLARSWATWQKPRESVKMAYCQSGMFWCQGRRPYFGRSSSRILEGRAADLK